MRKSFSIFFQIKANSEFTLILEKNGLKSSDLDITGYLTLKCPKVNGSEG